MHQTFSTRIRTLATVLALGLLPALAEAQTKVKPGYNSFSPEQDVEIGRQSAIEVERQLPVLQSDEVNDFVNDLGRRLAQYAPGPKFPYQFKVINASDLNAFALPGGPIYINRGIIDAARNEGEVAGVLAHEIAHVALRHGTHNASKAQLTQAGIGILGGLLGGKVGSGTAQAINVLGGLGLNALFLKYSRTAETEADIIGVQMLTKAGYRSEDMVGFFNTLARTDKRRTAEWMASHPSPDRRIEKITKEARLLGASTGDSRETGRFSNAQSIVRRMAPARTTAELAKMNQPPQQSRTRTSSRDGAWGGGRVEPPSRQLRTYTNREGLYQVAYPSNWRVYEGSRAGGVTIAPEGGVGEVSGRTEVVYGAIVSHYDPFGNEGNSRWGRQQSSMPLEQATDDLLKQITQTSPHLRIARGSQRRLRMRDGTGLGAVLIGDSPVTRVRERVSVVTRQLADGHLVYMLFITPDQEANQYEPVMQAMVDSLRIDGDQRH